jgi:hypothetical protein
MRYSWRSLLALALLTGTAGLVPLVPAPVRADGEAGKSEQEANRLLLRKWRADPEHYARLKLSWREFTALPLDRRERLRDLDRGLRALDRPTQAHLWAVLERYADWLEHLPEEDRRQVEAASDSAERLRVIKALRQREWLARLPRAVRERVQKAPEGPERDALLANLRTEERRWRQEWQMALRPPEPPPAPFRPTRLSEFGPEVQEYVQKSLLPSLPEEQRKHLAAEEGKPRLAYATALMHLAERHPTPLPPANTVGVVNAGGLPRPYRERVLPKLIDKELKELQTVEGRWPDYALALTLASGKHRLGRPGKPLGPTTPEGYTPAVQELIKLLARDPEAAAALDRVKGFWPEYPRTVMRLAAERGLRVPGTYLPPVPGLPGFWAQLKK